MYTRNNTHSFDTVRTPSGNDGWAQALLSGLNGNFDSFYDKYDDRIELLEVQMLPEMDFKVWDENINPASSTADKYGDLWIQDGDRKELFEPSPRLFSSSGNSARFRLEEGISTSDTNQASTYITLPGSVSADFSREGGKRPIYARVRALASNEVTTALIPAPIPSNLRELYRFNLSLKFKWRLKLDPTAMDLFAKNDPNFTTIFLGDACNGAVLEDSLCIQWCGTIDNINNSICRERTEAYCQGVLQNDGLEAALDKKICPCHLGGTFYNDLYNELVSLGVQITDASPDCLLPECASGVYSISPNSVHVRVS